MAPKRDRKEAFYSPSKENKKAKKGLSDAEADRAIESEEIKKMMADQVVVFNSLNGYASDLMAVELSDKDPKVIFKILMCEGWLDKDGRVTSKEGDLTVIWKDIKAFLNSQSRALVEGLTPDIEEVVVGEVTGDTSEELAKDINLKLKLIESATNKIIKDTVSKKAKISENEQKLIRADLEKEHLKLLGHDLNLEHCTKTNAWEISNFARKELIKNYAAKHADEANKKCSTGKEISENVYLQAHNLITRMTITAMGKAVKPNSKGITTVSLLLTFATEHDKDRFQHIAKDCGIGTKPSIPKNYVDQKAKVMNAYKDLVNANGGDTWVKVDVRQCRPDELMQFTVQTKKANSAEGKWRTAGKIVVIAPSMWGRWKDTQKDSFLKACFDKFE